MMRRTHRNGNAMWDHRMHLARNCDASVVEMDTKTHRIGFADLPMGPQTKRTQSHSLATFDLPLPWVIVRRRLNIMDGCVGEMAGNRPGLGEDRRLFNAVIHPSDPGAVMETNHNRFKLDWKRVQIANNEIDEEGILVPRRWRHSEFRRFVGKMSTVRDGIGSRQLERPWDGGWCGGAGNHFRENIRVRIDWPWRVGTPAPWSSSIHCYHDRSRNTWSIWSLIDCNRSHILIEPVPRGGRAIVPPRAGVHHRSRHAVVPSRGGTVTRWYRDDHPPERRARDCASNSRPDRNQNALAPVGK